MLWVNNSALSLPTGSNGQSNQTSMLTQRYVEELQALRNVLVSAKEDQEMLEGRVIEVRLVPSLSMQDILKI